MVNQEGTLFLVSEKGICLDATWSDLPIIFISRFQHCHILLMAKTPLNHKLLKQIFFGVKRLSCLAKTPCLPHV